MQLEIYNHFTINFFLSSVLFSSSSDNTQSQNISTCSIVKVMTRKHVIIPKNHRIARSHLFIFYRDRHIRGHRSDFFKKTYDSKKSLLLDLTLFFQYGLFMSLIGENVIGKRMEILFERVTHKVKA